MSNFCSCGRPLSKVLLESGEIIKLCPTHKKNILDAVKQTVDKRGKYPGKSKTPYGAYDKR